MSTNSHAVTVTDLIGIPNDADEAFTPIGSLCGLRLADGRLVRPWITWEIEEADGSHRELTHDDLLALGFQPSLETAISIEPELTAG